MLKPLLLSAAAVLSLSACASTGADMQADAAMAAGDMTPTQRGAYVEMAAASDLFEIQSGRMAAERGQSAAVRQFGTMPTPDLMPMQAQMMAELRATSGANFDRVFVRQQVQAHEMALALHSNYASRGDTPALRAVASAAVPVVRQHLEQARGMNM